MDNLLLVERTSLWFLFGFLNFLVYLDLFFVFRNQKYFVVIILILVLVNRRSSDPLSIILSGAIDTKPGLTV